MLQMYSSFTVVASHIEECSVNFLPNKYLLKKHYKRPGALLPLKYLADRAFKGPTFFLSHSHSHIHFLSTTICLIQFFSANFLNSNSLMTEGGNLNWLSAFHQAKETPLPPSCPQVTGALFSLTEHLSMLLVLGTCRAWYGGCWRRSLCLLLQADTQWPQLCWGYIKSRKSLPACVASPPKVTPSCVTNNTPKSMPCNFTSTCVTEKIQHKDRPGHIQIASRLCHWMEKLSGKRWTRTKGSSSSLKLKIGFRMEEGLIPG